MLVRDRFGIKETRALELFLRFKQLKTWILLPLNNLWCWRVYVLYDTLSDLFTVNSICCITRNSLSYIFKSRSQNKFKTPTVQLTYY